MKIKPIRLSGGTAARYAVLGDKKHAFNILERAYPPLPKSSGSCRAELATYIFGVKLAARSQRLNVKYPVHCRRILSLQQRDGDVVNGNSTCCFSIALAIVSMAMEHQVRSVAINNFSQA